MSKNVELLSIDELEQEVKRGRLLKEILEQNGKNSSIFDVSKIEHDIKVAQLAKLNAEAKVAERVTPVIESIKLISSLIIGIGGAIAGFTGFQYANAQRIEAVVAKTQAEEQRKQALNDSEKLKASFASLKIKNERIGSILDESTQSAKKLHDDTTKLLFALSKLKIKISNDPELTKLIDETGSRQMDLTNSIYAAHKKNIEQLTGKAIPPQAELVEEIFGESIDVRLTAFELLIMFYRNDEKTIPLLVARASRDRKNFNGLYNTFAALSLMPYEILQKHRDIVEPLLKVAEQIGPRTKLKADEVEKLLNNNLSMS